MISYFFFFNSMLQDYGYGGYGDSPAKAYALDGSEGVRNLFIWFDLI